MLRKLVLLGIGGFVTFVGGLATLLVAIIALAGEGYGTRLEFNGGEVFYTDAVQEAEANALGEYLVDGLGYFDGGQKSVQLDRRDGTLAVRFCVMEGAWDNAEAQTAFRAIQALLSLEVFDGEPIDIHLCNASMETRYVISAAEGTPLADLTENTDGNS